MTKLNKNMFSDVQEAMLELVQLENGEVVLRRPVTDDGAQPQESLVTISFSDEVKKMLGDSTQDVGMQMIHAGIQMVMNQQFAKFHTHVVDKEPENYS